MKPPTSGPHPHGARRLALGLVAALVAARCGTSGVSGDASPALDRANPDGSTGRDALGVDDVSATMDAATLDAPAQDATARDATTPDVPDRDAGPGTDASPPGDGASGGDPCAATPLRHVPVATAAALTAALLAARAGDRIELADGTYAGQFTAAASGTASQPIALCGTRRAVLDGGAVGSGYGLHLTGSWWILGGFTVTRSGKGIVTDGATHCVLAGLEVYNIGDEAIHFRSASTDNVLRDSYVHDTGMDSPGFGEGVYIGSAVSHWADYSDGGPDRSDRNQVLNNTIGPHTTAECIDVKEGTTAGVVRGNTFSGVGISGVNSADSWMDVKGNGYTIDGNAGVSSPNDGFQTHNVAAGWGNDNVFTNNRADVRGPGYGFRIQSGSTGNVVACSNVATAAAMGLANVACH